MTRMGEVETETGPLRRLTRYLRPYRRLVWLATLCSILNRLFDLAPPILIGVAVDVLVEQEESFIARLGVVNVMDQLWLLGGITLAVWILESLFEYALKLLWRNLAQTVQHTARIEAYEHVQLLDMAYFEDQSTGDLLAVLNDDVNQLERFLDTGANTLIQLAVTLIAIGGWFMYIAPSVAWLVVLPMPFIIWGSFWFQRFLEPLYQTVRERVGLLNSQLANNLGGIATIKSFTTEAYEARRITTLSEAYRTANRRAIRYSSAFVPLIRILIVTGFVLILIFGGQLVIEGALEVGLYSSMVLMTQRLLWPLTALGETLDQYQRAMASSRRLFALLDTPYHIRSGAQPMPAGSVDGAVAFNDVAFGYGDGIQVVSNLNIEASAGATIAIVGATGAGKSTVIKLLLRFYDVWQGSVTLDGNDVRDLLVRDLRGAIGLVSQDVYLFHGTVRENIAYGSVDADPEAIVAAAQVAEAHDFITALPHGYDTIVGERGQKLSGGQRQRLSIARAVLKDPPVLILDEATSAVDNETEAAIQRSMAHITQGRTTIIIAHRLSTVRQADKIYVMDKGRVVEAGRHDELLARGGIYNDLWEIQTGARAWHVDYEP